MEAGRHAIMMRGGRSLSGLRGPVSVLFLVFLHAIAINTEKGRQEKCMQAASMPMQCKEVRWRRR